MTVSDRMVGKYTPRKKKKRRSQMGEILRRLKKSKPAMISLAFILFLVLCAVFAPFIAPYAYDKQDLASKFIMPCLEHPLGTDNFGRDILSRLIYGGRISLLVSFFSVVLSVGVAVILGVTVGYFGGMYDNIVMRILDIFMAIPGMMLAISISAALGPGLINTAIAISIGGIPPFARQLRASVMLVREEEFVEASHAFGASHWRIMFKHILPNTLAPIIVQISLRLGENILSIAGLSFIGLGVQPPTPEWGNILSSGREFITTYWPLITFPGILIGLTMLAFNLFGDGLRDAMDPRLKQ